MHCESILKTFDRSLEAKSERMRSNENKLGQQNLGDICRLYNEHSGTCATLSGMLARWAPFQSFLTNWSKGERWKTCVFHRSL